MCLFFLLALRPLRFIIVYVEVTRGPLAIEYKCNTIIVKWISYQDFRVFGHLMIWINFLCEYGKWKKSLIIKAIAVSVVLPRKFHQNYDIRKSQTTCYYIYRAAWLHGQLLKSFLYQYVRTVMLLHLGVQAIRKLYCFANLHLHLLSR